LSETALAHSYAFEQLAPSEPASPAGLAGLVADAAAEADSIRELARSEGYAEGLAAGRKAGHAEVSQAARALGDALAGVQAAREGVAEAVERDAVELALALAEKILASALAARPELVVEVAHGALRRVSERRGIVLRVNPADLEAVRAAMDESCAQGGLERCEVQGDPRVGPGGAIAQTSEGEVDASVDTQLERAREAIRAELASVEPVA
jgi:flagellar assembly protein FliH